MRRLLAFLLCFVFLHSESYAIWGLGVGESAAADVTGTYSGTLIPSDSNPNTLGIFTVGVPTKGTALGAAFIFNSGGAFQGAISGVMDPQKLTFRAILQAVHLNFISKDNLGGSTISWDATSDGLIDATLKNKNGTLRMSGKANTSVQLISDFFLFFTATTIQTGNFSYSVDGFLQSKEVTTPTAASLAGTIGGT